MTWMQRLRARLEQRRATAAPAPLPDEPDGVTLTSPAELERLLTVWTRRWTRSRGKESDAQWGVARARVEAELRRFFGQGTLQRVQGACRGAPGGGGSLLLAADRLFVAFLGTRATMAVTRKLYSNLQ